ncbi:hypothetical protein HQ590_15190 [bacterium]|nr:hypothetical protein [bacterium]
MKTFLKVVAGAAAAALIVAAAPAKAQAGHRDGETAAAIIAGVATVGIIAALASHDRNVSVAVHAGYTVPPARWRAPPRAPVWVRGHYEVRREKVCIPGRWVIETIPAEYGWVRHGWRRHRVLIRPAGTRRVWIPERIEWRETRVWVPGHHQPTPRSAWRDDGHRGRVDRWARY